MSLLSGVLYFLCVAQILGTGDFSEGVGNILNLVQKTLGNIQGYVGEEDGCIFTCSNGAKPKPNLRHIKSSNGCGALGFKLDEYFSIERLTDCCDKHDLCYDTCGKSKRSCDNNFKECLDNLCQRMKRSVTKDMYQGCKSGADMMYAATVALGCRPYKDSQKNACVCESRRKSRIEL